MVGARQAPQHEGVAAIMGSLLFEGGLPPLSVRFLFSLPCAFWNGAGIVYIFP